MIWWLLVSIAGCQVPWISTPSQVETVHRLPRWPDEKPMRSAQSAIQLASSASPAKIIPNSFSTIPPYPLTVWSAIETGLASSPDLLALRATEPVARAALGVAETYPFNPYVQAQYLPGQSFPGGIKTHYVLLMQTLQLPRKQHEREDVAAAALNSSQWAIKFAELQNVATTRKLYQSILYQREMLSLAQSAKMNANQMLEFHTNRVTAGKSSDLDVQNARWDHRTAVRAVDVAQVAFEDARNLLARHLGISQIESETWEFPVTITEITEWPSPLEVLQTAGLENVADIPSQEGVVAAFLTANATHRPDVQAANCDVAAALAAHELAHSNRIPDLQIGPYYQQSQSTERFYGLRAQMEIPIWNNGRPLEQQRLAEWHRQTTVAKTLVERADAEIETAFERYERTWAALQSIRQDLPADLHSAQERTEAALKSGQVESPVAIQQRTRQLQQCRLYADALNDHSLAAISLFGASGLTTDPRQPKSREDPLVHHAGFNVGLMSRRID